MSNKLMKKMINQQRGIGLLELMLALAISAILIIVSVQYFSSTKNSTYVNAVVQEVQTIMSVANGLTDPAGSADCGDTSGTTEEQAKQCAAQGNLTQAVILSGSIPQQYINKTASPELLVGPWGKSKLDGYFIVNYVPADQNPTNKGSSVSESFITITGKNLPDYGCKSLESQFQGAPNLVAGTPPTCDIENKIFTISFYFASGDPIKVNSLN